MQKFKIEYKDRSAQEVDAVSYKLEESFFVFRDGDGIVLTIPADTVKAISRDGTPERSKPKSRPVYVG